ncbi:uncharacterized protein LOC116259071 [Nymphaea colorata]|uniref:Uncharacterized protein n=1 Tax=Nymphaea colorata TaxID=210225 RepID=A0A5K1FV82_9MAGN|nr:uncharacterized protein LOC116259071 [Nymphaea colorata]
MAAEWGFSTGDVLLRAGLFLVVQALVYLILKKSSSFFERTVSRSSSFRTVRSVSIRRMVALLSDLPAGEPSPTRSSSSSRLATQASM